MAAPHYAALDLGTNTFRLMIARPDPDRPSGTAFVHHARVITRAGGGFTETTGIGAEARGRIVACLREFAAALAAHGVTAYRAAATSVFRRAGNRDEVLAEVRRETGIEVEVIDGLEEAELSAAGALAAVAVDGAAVVFDIGGGSTEFIACEAGRVVGKQSFEFGVVRLSEDVLRGDPLTPAEIDAMHALVAPRIDAAAAQAAALLGGRPFTLVGTAGTVSTLGAIQLGLDVYDRDRINGQVLTRDFVWRNYERFRALTRVGRAEIAGMERGREDLIVPGTYIAGRTMDAFHADILLVSEGGLLEGLVFDVLRRHGAGH